MPFHVGFASPAAASLLPSSNSSCVSMKCFGYMLASLCFKRQGFANQRVSSVCLSVYRSYLSSPPPPPNSILSVCLAEELSFVSLINIGGGVEGKHIPSWGKGYEPTFSSSFCLVTGRH